MNLSEYLKEYNSMFEEHREVKQLIAKAEKVARREGYGEVVELLGGLVHHARVEEEVLYPSALLAGTLAKCLRSQTIVSNGIA